MAKFHVSIAAVIQLGLLSVSALAADAPAPDAFRVLPPASAAKPTITPYLKYQTEMVWYGDDLRRAAWEGIRTEAELLKFQRELRKGLLETIGSLPAEKTPLNARTTGRIQIQGFHVEKLVFESLPGTYVAALVYAPDDGGNKLNTYQTRVLLWLGENGKVSTSDWPNVNKYLDAGYDIVSIDPRGLGETRMPYKAASPDDPTLSQMDFDRAYLSPISGVLADYVYNSVLTGRPYLLQMIEDVEIATRFAREKINRNSEFAVIGTGDAYTIANAVAEALPNTKLLPPADAQVVKWSDLVEQKQESWPIQYLLPGGAYIH